MFFTFRNKLFGEGVEAVDVLQLDVLITFGYKLFGEGVEAVDVLQLNVFYLWVQTLWRGG